MIRRTIQVAVAAPSGRVRGHTVAVGDLEAVPLNGMSVGQGAPAGRFAQSHDNFLPRHLEVT